MADSQLIDVGGWLAGLATVGAAVGGFFKGRGQQREMVTRIHKVRDDAQAAVNGVSLATARVSERVVAVETEVGGMTARLDRIENKLDEALREMRR